VGVKSWPGGAVLLPASGDTAAEKETGTYRSVEVVSTCQYDVIVNPVHSAVILYENRSQDIETTTTSRVPIETAICLHCDTHRPLSNLKYCLRLGKNKRALVDYWKNK
jgi:hypothetical protein